MDFIEELKWRGLFYDMIPGTDEYLRKNKARGYIGFDPTAPSLGIGNFIQVILLMHFQRAGHQPIAVVGGATGMVGDPSGKSEERNLLSENDLQVNVENFKAQISKYLDFNSTDNPAIMVNNYDWYKNMNVLNYLRDIGKHLTVNYMMAKDSVKSRLETGISYTEFSYQLLQAYDFQVLYKDYDCKLQLGGSDQWGNLTAGVELIRRMGGGEAYAVTTPLVTKADGAKFGKTEKGNIFISPEMTSPYEFYQFWMNVSDEDAENFIKMYTFLPKNVIEQLIAEHHEAPHMRKLQKTLAEEVTTLVHSKEDYEIAVSASEILFGKGTKDTLQSMPEKNFLKIFEGVPQFNLSKSDLNGGLNVYDFLTDKTNIFPSRGEVRRTIQGGGLSINKEKVQADDREVTADDLLNNRYVLVQKGRRNYFLVIAD